VKLLELLFEGRIQDFKKLLDGKFNSEFLQRIVDRDTSKNHKNLMWIGKILQSEPDINVEELLNNLDIFNRIGKSSDLYQFKDYLTFLNYLQQKSKEVQMGKMATIKRSIRTIADTKRWQIVAPHSHDASKYFGGGTNWCISTSNDSHWNNHYYENTIIIIKDRHEKPDDKLFKVALVGDATGGFNSSTDKNEKIEQLVDSVNFWRSDDTRMSKIEAAKYASNLPDDLIDDIIYYLEDDDINERKYEHLYNLAHEKFNEGGREILVKQLYKTFEDILTSTIEIDSDVDEDVYDKVMNSMFTQEEWNWNEFLSQLWAACISEQGVDDEDFYPDLYDLKNLIDRNTEYSYNDVLEYSKEALKRSSAYDIMDTIIRDSIRGNIRDEYDEKIDPYYKLRRDTTNVFPLEGYAGILTQSLQMYNNKVNPSFTQGQRSLPSSEFRGVINKYTPKTIDDIIKVLSVNPKAIDMVKWIQRYRKDLRESKKRRFYKLFYKN